MLQGELDEKLDYSKHDYVSKETENSRNGFSEKILCSDFGDVLI